MRSEVMELLAANAEHADAFRSKFADVQDDQRPTAVTVTCSDSRVLADHVWGNDGPGRLFTCSNIGNRVVQRTAEGEAVSGDVLYPLLHTGAEIAIVVGHTGCGAVTAAYDDLGEGLAEPPGIAHSVELLTSHLEGGVERLPPDLSRSAAVNRLVEYNVDRQVDSLQTSDDVPDGVTVVGVVYDFQDVYSGRRGEVHVVNVDGESTVGRLRKDHPEITGRIRRLWEY